MVPFPLSLRERAGVRARKYSAGQAAA